MAKVVNGIEVPELVAEHDIDWSRYVAPGGNAWASHYAGEIKPFMDKSLENARKEINRLRAIDAERNAIRVGLAEAFNTANMAMGFALNHPEEVSEEERKAIAKFKAVTDFAVIDIVLGSDVGNANKIASITDDIMFMESLEKFYAIDSEVDKLLYALHSVAAKYRTKIFRQVLKLVRIIEEYHGMVVNSKSVIAREHDGLVIKPVRELWKVYQGLMPKFKEMKKAMDRSGIAFWKAMENDDALIHSLQGSSILKAAMADVNASFLV